MTDQRRNTKPEIGIFAIGLAAYWPQFESLSSRLQGYLTLIEQRLAQWGDVTSGGLVDIVEEAREAGALFARQRVDLIFTYAATHATSSQVLPALQPCSAPVIVLNLQPSAALDYETVMTEERLPSVALERAGSHPSHGARSRRTGRPAGEGRLSARDRDGARCISRPQS